jgi:hypothetical protein
MKTKSKPIVINPKEKKFMTKAKLIIANPKAKTGDQAHSEKIIL